MHITLPDYATAPLYYHQYFNLVKNNNLIVDMHQSKSDTLELFNGIPDEEYSFAYAEGKWTIAEVLQHIIDCERIMMYRAFRFSRFDATPLSGFNEDDYIEAARKNTISVTQLKNEYSLLRSSSILMFENMNEEMLDFIGIANQLNLTARAIGFMMVGHNLHHCNVVRDRYLPKL